MRYCHPKTLLSASYHVLFVTASCRLVKCWRRVFFWRHRDFLRSALPKRYTNHVHRTVTEVDTTRRIKTLWKRISPHRRKWEVAPATTSSQGKMICRGRHCCAVRSLYCSLSELCTLWFACTPPCKALCFQRDHSKSTVSSPLPTRPISANAGAKRMRNWFLHSNNTKILALGQSYRAHCQFCANPRVAVVSACSEYKCCISVAVLGKRMLSTLRSRTLLFLARQGWWFVW